MLAKLGPAKAYKRWGPTARYLTDAIPGHRFQIQTLDFGEIAGAIEAEQVDFLLANPAIYIQMADRFGVEKLVTLRNRVEGTRVSRSGGVLFTRAERSDLKTLADLRGQRMAAVAFNSLGGYLMARGLLQQHGLQPESDLAGLRFVETHDAVVQAVMAGEADFGTLGTDTLERMVASDRLQPEDFRIIHPHPQADFPAAVSTRLYPEWPLARTAATAPKLAEHVADVLREMPDDASPARQGDYAGWEPAADYQPVHDLLRKLDVVPYNNLSILRQAWKGYRSWILAAAGALLVGTAGLLFLLALHRRLRLSQRHYRLLLNSLGEGVFGLDTEGRFTFLNPRALDLFGFTDDESVLGENGHALTHHTDAEGHPYPESECPIYGVLATGEPLEAWEDLFWRADGVSFPVEVYAAPLRQEDGSLSGGVVVFADISQRKAAEARLQRRAEQYATVQAISTELLAAGYEAMDATIQDALARIGQAVASDHSFLFQLADDDQTMSNTHEWCAEGVSGLTQALQKLSTIDFPWLMHPLQRNEAVPIQSLAAIPDPGLRDLLARQGIRSLLVIPMVRGDELLGFVGLASVGSERAWSESEQDMLRIAADTLAGAVARQRLEMELHYRAQHDALTDLPNRRSFEEALAREAQRAQRYSHTFALIMLDIDHFKTINDTYGHELGDRILEEVSTLARQRLREADLLARWGGEEFMALLPETDEAGTRELANDLRQEVANEDFPGVGQLTISLGVAEYRPYEALKEVTKRVDDALYAAKEGGRNRVVVAGQDPGR